MDQEQQEQLFNNDDTTIVLGTDEMAMMEGELSDDEEIVLIVLQIVSAVLSLIGSATIVFKIVRCLVRNQPTTPYDRIMLGLSTCDIVGSITYAIGPFMLPSETSLRVWSFGNDQSCEILGFLNQFTCIGSVWYNCLLSFYYLLTVRYRVRRNVFHEKYETPMHLSALFFPLTGFLGYLFGWYAEQDLSMTCWISHPMVAYVLGAPPIVFTFLAIMVNNIVIYRYVRRSLPGGSDAAGNNDDDDDDNDTQQLPSASGNSNSSDRHADEMDLDSEASEHRPSSARSLGIGSAQNRLRTEAATQGFLYVASFYITWTPLFVIQVMGGSFGYTKEDQSKIYWLLVINALLLPLQGLFNVFIYVRPTYTRFKIRYPAEPALRVLRHALFDPNIPKLTTASVHSSQPSSGPFRFKFKRKRKAFPSLSKQKPIHQPGKPLNPINESYSREVAALEEDKSKSGPPYPPDAEQQQQQHQKDNNHNSSFEEETANWVTSSSSALGGGSNHRAAQHPPSDRV